MTFKDKIEKFKRLFRYVRVPFFPELKLYDLFRMYTYGIIDGFLTMRASAIAYNFFMALFPFLLFMISLIAFIPVPGFQDQFMQILYDALPPKTHDLFENIIRDIATNKRESLLSLGLILAVIFFTNGINAILTGFESSVNKIQDKRNFYKQYAFAFLIALSIIILLIITVSAAIYFDVFVLYNMKKHGVIDDVSLWLIWTKRLFYFLMILISTSILYKFGTPEGNKLPFFSPGSIISSVFFILGFYLYSLYILNFNKYNQLYGSIGALLILQLMIYVYAIILLLGHELNMSIVRLKTQNHHEKMLGNISS